LPVAALATGVRFLVPWIGEKVAGGAGVGHRVGVVDVEDQAKVATLDAYLAERARRAGLDDVRQLTGPLLATASGGRLRQGHLWELVRRLARVADVEAWGRLSPHSLRHSAITFAPRCGAALRDVQDHGAPRRIWLPAIVTHRPRTATSSSATPAISTPVFTFDSRIPSNGRRIPATTPIHMTPMVSDPRTRALRSAQ